METVSFLFWNLAQKPLERRVARLAALHDIQVVILAECITDPAAMCVALSKARTCAFCIPRSVYERIQIFTQLAGSRVIDKRCDPFAGLTIRHLKIGPPPGILLAAVHFPSKVNWDRDDQTGAAGPLAREIVRTEGERWRDRTVLVGDLNMNPFDPGVASALGLHAVMTQSVARKGERTVQGKLCAPSSTTPCGDSSGTRRLARPVPIT